MAITEEEVERRRQKYLDALARAQAALDKAKRRLRVEQGKERV